MEGTFFMLLPDPTVSMLDGRERRWKQTVSVVWVFELAYTPSRATAYCCLCHPPAAMSSTGCAVFYNTLKSLQDNPIVVLSFV